MENVAEALKIGFGVIIFATALTVLFHMSSLLRNTADEMFMAIDPTTSIEYLANVDETVDSTDGKRIVKFNNIIPTIYRYAQEGYGVTIIDENNIVARFDLDTESQVASCMWTQSEYGVGLNRAASTNAKKNSNIIKLAMEKYLYNNIFSVANVTVPEEVTNLYNIEDDDIGISYDTFDWLNNLIKSIYGTGITGVTGTGFTISTLPVYTSWLNGNKYSDNYITQRVNCDLYGGTTYFNTQHPGVSDNAYEKIGQHKAVLGGRGLLADYSNASFKEYTTEVDSNEYVIIDKNGNMISQSQITAENENDVTVTDLLKYGTIRYTKKRELIYVKVN